jgi:hypothetical protein
LRCSPTFFCNQSLKSEAFFVRRERETRKKQQRYSVKLSEQAVDSYCALTPATNDLLSLSVSRYIYKFVAVRAEQKVGRRNTRTTRARRAISRAIFQPNPDAWGPETHLRPGSARWQNNYLHLRRLSCEK